MSEFDPARRRFLKSTAIAGAAVTLGEFAWRSASAASISPAARTGETAIPPAPSWIDKPMRWAQLALVDDDPGKFDPQFWLDYFARTHADGACLSAGGCTAFYPTTIPFHHRSPWLGDRDVFGELAAGCRKLGMVVIARTDPHATYDDVKAAHPDWIAVTEDGRPRRHWSSPEMWVTCGLGPYNFDFMTEVKQEIMSRYRVDAIFINRWEGSGLCYCEHCRANFKNATGYDLPAASTSIRDPARRAYFHWRQQRVFELWRHWDSAVRAINPDSCVIPNTAGGPTGSLDMKHVGELAPMSVADRQARHGLMPLWIAGKNGKEYRATAGQKPVIGLFGVGLEEPYRWKDSVQSADEIRLWAIDAIANGARPWFVKFAGALNDPRWLKPVEDLFVWCHGAERYLRNERPLARVAVVYSQQTFWFYDTEDHNPRDAAGDAALGWYQALVEARVPFEMVHDQLLDPRHLANFKTLILPNIAALSDRQCAQLREFVQRGGSLIATSESSLYDETGARRKDFGLADLFGVSSAGVLQGPMHNAYLRLEHDAARGHPLLRGLENAPRTIHGVWRLEVEPKAKFPAPPLTLIPAYPDLPMEKVFARQPKTDIAQVFLRDVGAGRVAYFPWDIDRTYWEVLDVDHGQLLRNAIAWATNEPVPVSVTGPGVLDVTFWKQSQSVTIHLVNLTNPMMMKGPIRELVPIGAQTVRARLPDGLQAKSVRLLVADKTSAFHQTGEWIDVVVPSILAHEVIAIDV